MWTREAGSGTCGRPHRKLKNLRDLHVIIEFFMKRLWKSHKKFRQMKYRKFARQIPKIREISEKRGNFSDSMWTSTRGRGGHAHVDRGSGRSKTRFSWGRHKINGWPLIKRLWQKQTEVENAKTAEIS